VTSNDDPETRSARVGACIVGGAVDAVATEREAGAGARFAGGLDRAVNVVGRGDGVFHSDSFRVPGRNDCPRGRAGERRRGQVERETRHRERALPDLIAMPRPIGGGSCERARERATARRPGIDPCTARDREGLGLRSRGLDHDASRGRAHIDIDRSLARDLETHRIGERLAEPAGAQARPPVHRERERSGRLAQSAEGTIVGTRVAVGCTWERLAAPDVRGERQRRVHVEGSGRGRHSCDRGRGDTGHARESGSDADSNHTPGSP